MANAEVTKLGRARRVEEYIRGLYIPVNDAARMKMQDGTADRKKKLL
jgi:hypothetical protein